ncbi:hypothetical protein D1007_32029 [Hordeum vulgare]|nr:hypothetical protein D1007_32029 [Hordeum vulgare]
MLDFSDSYTRIRAHLLKILNAVINPCTKITQPLFEELRNEDKAAAILISHGKTRNTLSLPPFEESGPSVSSRKRKVAGKQSGVSESFHSELRQQADALIARMFITGGVPFNLARNPYYRESYNFIANNELGGYAPPEYNALRTTCLAKEKKYVGRMLEPLKSTWPLKGVTIATDGWSDPQRRPILNFMAVAESGPMFLKAINTEGEVKSKQFIFEKMKEVVEDIGYENVVQVITDNASNVKGAGLMIQAKYNNIYWTPCIVHCLNLVLKDICDPKMHDEDYEVLHFIEEVADLAQFVKKFIMTHGMRSSMLNEFSKLKFLHIAETRFASVVIMLKRFLLIKDALTLMVIHASWANYREDDPITAQRVKELILSDLWWDKIAYIVSFTSPIYSMIRLTDTDKPSLHLIYEMRDDMIEKNADSIEDIDDFEPKQWWGTDRGSTKFLKILALKLLGQPSSSSCYERNWSPYSFIHSSERNKLTPEHVEDLVFAHNNLRLLSRQSKTYHVGPSQMWDVGGDGVESFTGVGMLEGANLTLDEPELEVEITDALTWVVLI